MKLGPIQSSLCLLFAALLWGTTFGPQKTAMAHMGPLFYTGLRFLLGSLALYPFIRLLRRWDHRPARAINAIEWKLGILFGLFMFAGIALQQIGLVETTASKASFITGLYVILVPLVGIFLGQRVSWVIFVCAIVAFIGLYLLSIPPGFQFDSTAKGDIIIFIGALAWVGHVLAIGGLGNRGNALHLSFVQFITTAVLSLAFAGYFEGWDFAAIPLAWVELLYGGLLSVTIGFTLQVVGQQGIPPSTAAIILSLETVFGALTGWLYLNEIITTRAFIGISLMFAAMLASQLAPYWQRRWQRKTTYPLRK